MISNSKTTLLGYFALCGKTHFSSTLPITSYLSPPNTFSLNWDLQENPALSFISPETSGSSSKRYDHRRNAGPFSNVIDLHANAYHTHCHLHDRHHHHYCNVPHCHCHQRHRHHDKHLH